MSTYKCCKCENTLTPQGPINALVIHDQGRETIQLYFNDDGNLSDQSLNNALSIAPQSNVLQLDIAEPVKGSLADFTFNSLTLLAAKPRISQEITQKLTICCKNCGACCEYSYNQ